MPDPSSFGGEDSDEDDGDTPNTELPPSPEDEAKLRSIAEELAKEAGYRSVEYRGNRTFFIDYALSGTLTHNFAFPFNSDAAMIIPFVAVELRGKDQLKLFAPAFGGTPEMNSPKSLSGGKNRLDGHFTLTTDSEFVEGGDGVSIEADGLKQKVWRVTPDSEETPTAILRVRAL